MMSDAPRFRCLTADPPWPERGGCNRGVDAHYEVQRVEDLPRIVMASPLWLPETSSHLWMWATVSHLPQALWLTERLGYRYVTHLVWVKAKDDRLQQGLGQYVRGSHELLLLGTRGGRAMVPIPALRPPSVFRAARTRHSAKPAVAYEIISQISPGPRAELFARSPRPGWWVWGDEVPTEDCVWSPGEDVAS
jgi:N6-adenosine-specific RNA methylase IME4